MPPLKVLILDDEPIVGKRLKPALGKYGVEVEIFEDPHQAVARINETEFDIVVSDVRMEAMDGLKVLETVRARSSRTKVIIISGYATVEVAREALVKGAFDFIAKPFKPNDLRLVINKAAKALGYPGIGTLEEQELFKN
jgi:DNA-binding NtrC family response regulator